MRSRLVEALHAAMAAEEMLGGAAAEAITRKRITPAEKLELLMRDVDVQIAGHTAHRAIAVERGNRRFRHLRFEPHSLAMASAPDLHGLRRNADLAVREALRNAPAPGRLPAVPAVRRERPTRPGRNPRLGHSR